MKRSIKLAVAAAVALTSTAAFATNGDNLIATGAKSLGMGGASIAHFDGAESATANPALIAKSKGTEFTIGGTYFRPNVKVQVVDTTTSNGTNVVNATSDAKNNVIPYVALTENLDNGFSLGLSMYGSAGMGTDYRSSAPAGAQTVGATASNGAMGLYSMRSNLMLLKFSAPVAYGQDNWSVGIAPVVMYGSLDIAFRTNDTNSTGGIVGVTGSDGLKDVGRGSSSDIGLGYEAGAAYTLKDMGVTAAVRYQSAIMMEYKNQISVAGAAFGYTGTSGAFMAKSDKLEQPAEYGIGLDWTQGDLSLTADWKKIQWGSAAGYKDFGWMDQNVYAVGAEYRMDKLALRLGYNYAKNPISINTDATAGGGGNKNGETMNVFNHILFPAITEKHYTVGAGYEFTKNVGADVAFMYATSPRVSVTAPSVTLDAFSVQNNQKAVSANLNYKF